MTIEDVEQEGWEQFLGRIEQGLRAGRLSCPVLRGKGSNALPGSGVGHCSLLD